MAENEAKTGIDHIIASVPAPMSELKKTAIMEGLWLNYYNDTLFAHGLITEAERNKMRLMTKRRTASRER